MINNESRLDTDELLQLALRDLDGKQHDKALEKIDRAIKLSPQNAQAYYLLGAAHAQIGRYDQAVEDMTRATGLAPGLYAAHFQLGLLHLSSGRAQAAEQSWEPLMELGKEHPLYLFSSGLRHLAKDEFEACMADLEKGIALNQASESLNRDMGLLLKSAREALKEKETANTPFPTPGTGPALLSAYREPTDKRDA